MYVGTAAVSYYDVYVTKESIEPKDKEWAKDMNVFQRMYYDYAQKEKETSDVLKWERTLFNICSTENAPYFSTKQGAMFKR